MTGDDAATPAFVRVTTAAQMAEVEALAREIWPQHYVPVVSREQIDYMLDKFQSSRAIREQIESGGYEYYLLEGAAYLALVPDVAAGRMQLSKIYVRKERRGAGLGAAMVALAVARCRERGCRELWLTVNKRNAGSILFYKRHGFQITAALETDIGGGFVMDDWQMAMAVE